MAWPLRVRATVADQRPLCSRSRAWLGDLVAGGLHCCDELLLHVVQLVGRIRPADQVLTVTRAENDGACEVIISTAGTVLAQAAKSISSR